MKLPSELARRVFMSRYLAPVNVICSSQCFLVYWLCGSFRVAGYACLRRGTESAEKQQTTACSWITVRLRRWLASCRRREQGGFVIVLYDDALDRFVICRDSSSIRQSKRSPFVLQIVATKRASPTFAAMERRDAGCVTDSCPLEIQYTASKIKQHKGFKHPLLGGAAQPRGGLRLRRLPRAEAEARPRGGQCAHLGTLQRIVGPASRRPR